MDIRGLVEELKLDRGGFVEDTEMARRSLIKGLKKDVGGFIEDLSVFRRSLVLCLKLVVGIGWTRCSPSLGLTIQIFFTGISSPDSMNNLLRNHRIQAWMSLGNQV